MTDPVPEPTPATEQAFRAIRRGFVALVGATLVGIGAALLVLPGPGVVVIAAGLALLATEFVWARVWLQRVRRRLESVTNGSGSNDAR